jgi:glutamate racemase
MSKQHLNNEPGAIGIFDSGYGGLTILEEIKNTLPEYDYIYLGDNARSPYGTRSFDVVYKYTLECVTKLFEMGCHLVILACNTASAKALRTIQQLDLPKTDSERRVLGIIRPTVEVFNNISDSKFVGIFATPGTVQSESYLIEAHKICPDIHIIMEACPMWVPLIENNEHLSKGAEYFVEKNIQQLLEKESRIDRVILGCTHYPLIKPVIRKFLPKEIKIVSQGKIVAASLKEYLERHPEIDKKCTKNYHIEYYTTESPEKFMSSASIFLQQNIRANHLKL